MNDLKEAKERYNKKSLDYSLYFYPNLPKIARVITIPNVKKTGGLTNAIKKYIILKGWFCERINTTGRQIDNRETVTDILGRKRQIGSLTWIKSTGKKGSSDLSANINSKSVKIEIKNKETKDKASPDQEKYKDIMSLTGATYYTARNFEDTIGWLDENFEDNTDENKHKLWELLKKEEEKQKNYDKKFC